MISRNVTIAKNTVALYFRTFLTVIVSLYTSRIVLEVLGVSDFGLFALVAGVVTLMGFLQAAMMASTQRFLNYEKGIQDPNRLRRVFGTSLVVHIYLAAVILLIAETLGLWLLNTQLNIDPSRITAANWIFQFSLLSILFLTVSSPYNAAIIANERMAAFAYIGLLEAALKLIVASLLFLIDLDTLVVYGVLMFWASTTVAICYALYARYYFAECRVGPVKDSALFWQLLSFASWSMLSNLSVVLRIQGMNIILNVFFGTIVNAAFGIAAQVSFAVRSFSLNFAQALNPQIVKNYAAGDLEEMHVLIINGCRLSFILILFVALPVLIEADSILSIWLTKVPPNTIIFVQLILIQALIESFAGILGTAQGATGKVRRYHLTLSFIGLTNLPVIYLLFLFGFPPYISLVVSIVISGIIGISRLIFLRYSIRLSGSKFARKVIVPCSLVAVLAPAVPLLMRSVLPDTVLISFLVCVIASLSVLVTAATVGIDGDERRIIARLISRKLKELK